MTLDINSIDFVPSFDISKGTVGVIGHGYVGQAVEAYFKRGCTVMVYDKDPARSKHQLTDVVRHAEVIFICVPTPMRKDGSCFTGIIESVLNDIETEAKTIKRNPNDFIIVIKSTVRPGFTEEMQALHLNLRILFSPEFLTEKNSIKDFERTNRVILGGDEDDARVVFKYFEGIDPQRIESDQLVLMQCDPTVAEMAKLYTNGILMTKVLFSNEIYLMCQKLGIDYKEVRFLALLDQRIGVGHTKVPGHDGLLGGGGSCFPKDINNLRSSAKELGVAERMFTAVIERNNEIREQKDWMDLKGRAILDD